VKFIHVGRDGRDAALSLHNHHSHYTPAFRTRFSSTDPASDPPAAQSAAEFFSEWIKAGGSRGNPDESFVHVENSYWAARDEPDMLLVHYSDLKADLGGEMRRIAGFLGIGISEALWPQLIEAASFEAMQAQGDLLMPIAREVWDNGAKRFFNQGTNGQWRTVCSPDDLARYDELVSTRFTPDLAHWLEHGRLRP
jgi:aryl sulfotransferase